MPHSEDASSLECASILESSVPPSSTRKLGASPDSTDQRLRAIRLTVLPRRERRKVEMLFAHFKRIVGLWSCASGLRAYRASGEPAQTRPMSRSFSITQAVGLAARR